MKKLFLSLVFLLLIGINLQAQTVSLFMAERYDIEVGPIGVSGVYTTGYLTVVAVCSEKMYYDNVFIQYDKQSSDGQFYFYKQFPFTFPNGYSTVYFSRVGDNDMEFEDVGIYRVFLLNKYLQTIAYTTVTIVAR